jgi:excisionase family DNA binding protein
MNDYQDTHISVREYPALLTREQAADRLGTTERHVRRLVERGILTSVRLGGKVRIRTDDLEACVLSLPRSHSR